MPKSKKRFPPSNKINDSKSGCDDLLPTDDELLARTKIWSSFFSKYNIEEDESLAVDLTNDDCIAELLNSDEESSESVASSDFVDTKEKDDPNFDVEKVLNQTKKVIEKRKKKWGRSGFDKVMESSFCMDEYSKKVDNWLNGNSRYLPDYNFRRNTGLPCPREVQITDRRVYVERSSSTESDGSVDTVKYILSNKKKQKSGYRTMTIKEYRCRKTVSKMYDESFTDFGRRKLTSPRSRYAGLTVNHQHYCNSAPTRHKFKKRQKQRSFRVESSPDLSSSSDSRSEGAGRFRRSKQPKRSSYKKLYVSREVSPISDRSESQYSRITFVPENVVNSTVISKLPVRAPCRNDLEPILEDNESTQQILTSSEPKNKQPTPSPIVIYTPEDPSKSFESSITNGKILLTSQMLENSIGSELAKNYLNFNKDFSCEFDQHSKILFYPPEVMVVTSDSEAEILDYLSSNTTGKIVEILNAK